MAHIDWTAFAFGVLFIVIGLAFFFSRRFGDFAYKWTTQGEVWKGFLGDEWGPVVAKYFFSCVSIAIGAFVLYESILGSPH